MLTWNATRQTLLRPWHRKLVVDTLKAFIPFRGQLRALWRRLSPYETDASNDLGLLIDAIDLAALARPNGKVVLEFGSGWNPILPLVFRLAGATRVVLTDQERLLDGALVAKAMGAVRSEWPRIRSSLGLPDEAATLLEIDCTQPLPELLAALGLSYVVPFKARSVPEGSIDIVVSRAVLEHIPEQLLTRLLPEFARMLAPGGLMVHRVDMSDHWEHKDKSISAVNFLRYGDALWRLTQFNPQNVQNRLRREDFARLFEAAGYCGVSATGAPHAPSLAALRNLPLAQRFRGMPPEELAIIDTIVTAYAPAAVS